MTPTEKPSEDDRRCVQRGPNGERCAVKHRVANWQNQFNGLRHTDHQGVEWFGSGYLSRSAADVTKAGAPDHERSPPGAGGDTLPEPSVNRSAAETDGTCDVDELVSRLGSLPYVRDVLEDPEHAAENMPGANLAATLYMTVELMEWAVDTRAELARLRADLERVTTERDDRTRERDAMSDMVLDTMCVRGGEHRMSAGEDSRLCWKCDVEFPWTPGQWVGFMARRALAATEKNGGDRT